MVLESSGPIGKIQHIKLWNEKEKRVPFMKLSRRMVRGVDALFTEIFFYLVMIFPLKYDNARLSEKQNEF